MKKIKRDGVRERYPYLSEDEVAWYQHGYNSAVRKANKEIQILKETIAWLQENPETLKNPIE